MKSVFATVGTTSFDDFVQALCSIQFLTAMAHRQSPVPPSSIQSLCDCNITIQYGQGRCPLSFISHSMSSITQETAGDDDSGSIMYIIETANDIPNKHSTEVRIQVRWYRFLPSLSAEMERADIILCHAGAGTLLEALAISSSDTKSGGKQKKIINAVINSKLMGNHQTELAEELEKRSHIHVTRDCISEWTTEARAVQFWKEIDEFAPLPFSGGHCNRSGTADEQSCNQNVSSFQRIVDRVMNYSDD